MAVAALPADPLPLYDVGTCCFDRRRLREAMLRRGLLSRDFIGPREDGRLTMTTAFRALRGERVSLETAGLIYAVLDSREPMTVGLLNR